MTPAKPLKVALLGCGVVGSEVARLLLDNADEFQARIGRRLELVGIAVRTLTKERPGIDRELLTDDALGLVGRKGIDLVIEVMGGVEPARTLILAALANGASVITANKQLLAQDGSTLYTAAAESGVDLYFEAAVAGAIPIIRPLRESLVGDEVTAVKGIVNGTTNFILDKMHTEGSSFDEVLAEAQRLGFAEEDPTADVEGLDAAAKAAILASLAFHSRVKLDDVDCEGITKITPSDVSTAQELGYVIKLLARCALAPDGSISVGVHPTMVPSNHPLANVSGAFNAVFIESRHAGQLMFMGPGAGGSPTASAVLGDVVTAARNRVRGVAGPGESAYTSPGITDPARVVSAYYIAMTVRDEPGVLARVSEAMARRGISIATVRQEQTSGEDATARLGITTHRAPDGEVRAVVAELTEGGDVLGNVRVLRVEGA